MDGASHTCHINCTPQHDPKPVDQPVIPDELRERARLTPDELYGTDNDPRDLIANKATDKALRVAREHYGKLLQRVLDNEEESRGNGAGGIDEDTLTDIRRELEQTDKRACSPMRDRLLSLTQPTMRCERFSGGHVAEANTEHSKTFGTRAIRIGRVLTAG